MSIVLVGSTSGSVTLQEPAVAGTTVLDLPATSGTVLTSASSVARSQLPVGSVLQVVSTTLTTLVTASSNTWTTITSASITPTSASNRILIMFNMPVGAVGQETLSRVLRGSTVITEYTTGDVTQIGWSFTGNGSAGWQGAVMSGSFRDSPSTTSSITYNLQAYQEATTLYVNRTSGTSSSDSAGGVTTITLMEIAA
jgi:hypothetical protein